MAGFTKKIAAQQSQAAVTSILTHCSAQPRLVIPLFWTTLQEKTVQARAFVVAHMKNYLEVHGARSKNAIESSGGAETLEKCLKRALADANVGVRESARVCFWVFEGVWHERGLAVLGTLDSLARKQLEKVCPNSERAAVITQPSTPTTKKTSIAAAIAASRAKAKAIATSPPSLRHQATSSSHAARAISPSSAGTRASVSPPASPRSRIISSMARNSSNPAVLPKSTSHSRSPSSSSTPSTSPESIRRNSSSPLGPSPSHGSTLRRAAQIALPASPPKSTITLVHPPPRRSISRNTAAVPVPPRESNVLPQMNGEDDNLLLASTVPIPEDSDSDPEESANLMSFSTPFELYPPNPPAPKSNSHARSFSLKSSDDSGLTVSNALSNPEHTPGEIVEDALRARAEQAESAAERLLELVEPEENGNHHSTIPASLLLGSNGGATPKSHSKTTPGPVKRARTVPQPVTPLNRNANILRQASLFKNSPAYNGTSPSLLDVLKDRKNETSWWLKRMNSM
jgi:CLIP-associating protein 1/2